MVGVQEKPCPVPPSSVWMLGDDHVVLRRLRTPAAAQRDREQPGGQPGDPRNGADAHRRRARSSAAGQLVALGQDGLELHQLFLGGVHQRRTDGAHGQAAQAQARP